MAWNRKRREIERLREALADARAEAAEGDAARTRWAVRYAELQEARERIEARHARVVLALATQQARTARYRTAWIAAGRDRARLRALTTRPDRAQVTA